MTSKISQTQKYTALTYTAVCTTGLLKYASRKPAHIEVR